MNSTPRSNKDWYNAVDLPRLREFDRCDGLMHAGSGPAIGNPHRRRDVVDLPQRERHVLARKIGKTLRSRSQRETQFAPVEVEGAFNAFDQKADVGDRRQFPEWHGREPF